MASLACLLLRMGRDSRTMWLSAACTLLGIVAMSPELQLQPHSLSILLLGLTFWLLWLPCSSQRPRYRDGPRLAGLLVLFVLWANLDGWFWIGPALVALVWLGERLSGNEGSTRNTPGWLVPASVVVCMLNPHYWHVFVPVAGSVHDWRAASPWQQGLQPLREVNVSTWAYFFLVAFGLLSFVLNRGSMIGWRILAWVGFFFLAAWQMNAIPYFAVVAAPITALNFQDYLNRRPSLAGRWTRFGRIATLASALALIGLACPGWLQGFKDDSRRVGWGVRAEPSLQRLAETIRAWRAQGLRRDGDRGLVLDRDIAHYLAWFCPDEKIVFRERSRWERPSKLSVGLDDLRQWDINYWIVADAASFRVLHRPHCWTLLHVDGRAAILGWRPEAGCARPVAVPALDGNRLAYLDSGMPATPGQGPQRDRSRGSLDAADRRFDPTLETEAAGTYLRYFRAEELPQHQQRAVGRWAAYSAGLTGMPATATGLPVVAGLVDPQRLLGDLDGDLPALPLVTIRLCRTALAADPDDVDAHVRLGQAYLALDRLTGERSQGKTLPLLVELRHVQMVTALEQALSADPDQETAHQLLANIYLERGHLDAALLHRREELRLARRPVSTRFEQTTLLAEQVKQLDQAVQNARKAWQIRTRAHAAADPVADAEAGLHLGLARAALDEVLLPAPQELLGSKGLRLECSLALQLGRAEQLRRLLLAGDARQHRQNLGHLEVLSSASPHGDGLPAGRLPAYDWLVPAAGRGLRRLRSRRATDPGDSWASGGSTSAELDHCPATSARGVGLGARSARRAASRFGLALAPHRPPGRDAVPRAYAFSRRRTCQRQRSGRIDCPGTWTPRPVRDLPESGVGAAPSGNGPRPGLRRAGARGKLSVADSLGPDKPSPLMPCG